MLTRRYGGVSHSTISILNALAKRARLDVHVASFEVDPDVLPAHMPVTRLPPLPQRRFAWRFGRALSVGDHEAALRSVRLPSADLVYTRWMDIGLAYGNLHPHASIVCHSGHMLAEREALEDSALPPPWRRLDAWVAGRLERACYDRSNWTHVVSTRLVRDTRARHFGLNRHMFLTQPLGVDVARFADDRAREPTRARLGARTDDCVVVAVARLVAWKNLDWLVRSLPALPRNVRLVLVGDGPERVRLEQAVDPAVRDRVLLTGHADPRPWLAAADVFALPSTIESFGIAYVEAMAAGLPCVGLRYRPPRYLSSAGEVIRHGESGLLVESEDELRQALDLLAGAPDLRRRMGAEARETAATLYTSDAYASFLERLADELLGTESRTPIVDEALAAS